MRHLVANTDVNGQFIFASAVDAEYVISIGDMPAIENYTQPLPETYARGGQRNVAIILSERNPADFVSLTAEIVDGNTGKPAIVTDASVARIDIPKYRLIPARLAPGRVEHDKLGPGKWRLTVHSEDSVAVDEFVVARSDKKMRRTVIVGSGELLGQVHAIEGIPADTMIQLHPRVGRALDSYGKAIGYSRGVSTIDENGKFRFDGVPAGRITVAVVSSNLKGETALDVPSGRAVSCTLYADPCGELELRGRIRVHGDSARLVLSQPNAADEVRYVRVTPAGTVLWRENLRVGVVNWALESALDSNSRIHGTATIQAGKRSVVQLP
jgi:hypothetical protein